MDDAQTFDAIADERRVLADVLDELDETQWATQSLCGAWDVRGVAAHLLGPTVTGIPEVLWLVLRARGDFEKSNMALTDRVVAEYGTQLPQMLRDKFVSSRNGLGCPILAVPPDLWVDYIFPTFTVEDVIALRQVRLGFVL